MFVAGIEFFLISVATSTDNHYIGCYNDTGEAVIDNWRASSNRALNAAVLYDPTDMSIDWCISFCNNNGEFGLFDNLIIQLRSLEKP